MPSTSRPNSSSATPKMNKGKAPQSPTSQREDESSPSKANGIPSTPRSGIHSGPQFSDDVVFTDTPSPKKNASPNPKSKNKSKRKDKQLRKKSKNSIDLLARVFLLFFLVYSLAVCPSDKELQSPVCRGLSEYRRLVLEPLVIRPFQNALHHPSVAPYVDTVAPHVQSVLDTVSPVVERTQQEWNSRVTPAWKKHVVPQLDKHVSPQLVRLDLATRPYRQSVSSAYQRNIGPYVVYSQRLSRRARPYLLLTAAKIYDSYQTVKPHVLTATSELGRVPPLFIRYVLVPLDSARRQFVDPHVATIVEKIKELSSGAPKSSSDGPDTTVPPVPVESIEQIEISETEEIVLPPIPEPTDGPAKSAASIISASAYLSEEITESVPGATYSPSPSDFAADSEEEDAIPPPPEPELEVEAQNTEENSSSKPLVTKVQVTTVLDTVIEVVVETATAVKIETVPEVVTEVEFVTVQDAAKEVPYTPSSVVTSVEDVISGGAEILTPIASSILGTPSASSSAPSSSVNESELDLDAFYADLGIDEDDSERLQEEPEEEETLSAEQIAQLEREKAEEERLKALEIAEKRRELVSRHEKWEGEVEGVIKEQRKALRKGLVAVRKAAATDLKESKAIRDEVEKLNFESERTLKGTEAYFKKLAKEGKTKEESIRLWDRVLTKVESKFSDRVDVVEDIVNRWYQAVYGLELGEVQKAHGLVKDLIERAQADIGFDYVWLDDVTVQDWDRYHKLQAKNDDFLDQALSIQNGSHPSPPINPVLKAMEDLQSEVNDIVIGFETRLRRIKREGDRAFASDNAQDIDKLDVDDASETGEGNEPEMSILPVPDVDVGGSEEGKGEEEMLQDVSNAILGRSEKEVVEALGRSEALGNGEEKEVVENEKVKHEEL